MSASLARKGYIFSPACDWGYNNKDIDHVGSVNFMKSESIKKKIRNRKCESITGIIKGEDWDKMRVIADFTRKIGKAIWN